MKKFIILPIMLLALLQLSTVAQKKGKADSIRTVMNRTEAPALQYGIASFYDDKFEGRRTANGDIFSQKRLTAASNTLPLNSWVKVTNLSNKRSVIVLITDRMHHNNHRLIDLSRAAASKLSYISKGLTRVKVENLGRIRPATAGL